MFTFEVDPSTAVSIHVGDHVVYVGFGQVITKLLQDPSTNSSEHEK